MSSDARSQICALFLTTISDFATSQTSIMSVPQTSVSVLIPACNEEGALADTVAAIERHRALFGEMEIIVINDGSSDRTGEVAR